MRKHLLTNLSLLLIIITLGTFLSLDENNVDPVKKLSSLPVSSVQTIHIYHNKREISLNKSTQQWSMSKPIEISANQSRIKTLLNLLNTDSYAQYNTNNLDLKKYGLYENSTQISFNETLFVFGMINPINNYRYVKSGNTLHLIDDHFYPLISSQIGTLIARQLLPDDSTISKLVLPDYTFTRDEDQLWKSESNLSTDAIVDTIYQWKHKSAFAVHDYMQRVSLGEIQVFFDDSETPIIFKITDIDPWLIIARPDIKLEYHFNIDEYDELLKPGVTNALDINLDNSLHVSPDDFMDAIQAN